MLREGRWLREHGLEPRFFCGGGWYIDAAVMAAVAELGYVDCTATAVAAVVPAARVAARGARRAGLDPPRRRHGAFSSCRARTRSAPRRASLAGALPPVVHVHFHDYELLEARRRAALSADARLLARRRRPVEPGAVAAEREVSWADVCAD